MASFPLFSPVAPEILQQLGRFDSATVSNVIELFGIRPHDTGFLTAEIQSLVAARAGAVVGYASTATFRASEPHPGEGPPAGLLRHLEAMSGLPEPRIVVCQDLDEPSRAATFGELMAHMYRNFGAVGFVTSGWVRDLAAIRETGLGVWAGGVCVSHGYGRIVDVHTDVHLGSTVVRPGDLIHADQNGVVLIPAQIAEEVAALCPKWVAAEQTYLKELAQSSNPEVVALALRNLQAAIREMQPR